jgi:hypothetical protein
MSSGRSCFLCLSRHAQCWHFVLADDNSSPLIPTMQKRPSAGRFCVSNHGMMDGKEMAKNNNV